MATVMVIIPGSAPKLVQADTIASLKAQLSLGANYKAMVEGNPASDDTVLADAQRVTLAETQKGA